MSGLIIHDYLMVPGGAEKLIMNMTESLSAELIVGFEKDIVRRVMGYDDLNIKYLNSRTINKLMDYAILYYKFRRLKLKRDYSWVIYSGNFAPLAIMNNDSIRSAIYCHNVPRFIYDKKDDYENLYSPWEKPLFKLVSSYIKSQYEKSFNKMDVIIANSDNTRKKIKKYLKRESVVVYPPCDITSRKCLGQGNYYVSTARLEGYKRVEFIVRAFLEMPDKNLVIVSGGSDYERLRELSQNARNIIFKGWVSESELESIVGNSIASIYVPDDEDFGMSVVESMSQGKPVIGVSSGGLTETIVHGETGYLISEELTVDKIIKAVEFMTPSRAKSMQDACMCKSEKFTSSKFARSVLSIMTG